MPTSTLGSSTPALATPALTHAHVVTRFEPFSEQPNSHLPYFSSDHLNRHSRPTNSEDSLNVDTLQIQLDTFVQVPQTDTFVQVPQRDTFVQVPQTDTFVQVPQTDTFVQVPQTDTFVQVPQTDTFVQVPQPDTFVHVPQPDTFVQSHNRTPFSVDRNVENRLTVTPCSQDQKWSSSLTPEQQPAVAADLLEEEYTL